MRWGLCAYRSHKHNIGIFQHAQNQRGKCFCQLVVSLGVTKGSDTNLLHDLS